MDINKLSRKLLFWFPSARPFRRSWVDGHQEKASVLLFHSVLHCACSTLTAPKTKFVEHVAWWPDLTVCNLNGAIRLGHVNLLHCHRNTRSTRGNSATREDCAEPDEGSKKQVRSKITPTAWHVDIWKGGAHIESGQFPWALSPETFRRCWIWNLVAYRDWSKVYK